MQHRGNKQNFSDRRSSGEGQRQEIDISKNYFSSSTKTQQSVLNFCPLCAAVVMRVNNISFLAHFTPMKLWAHCCPLVKDVVKCAEVATPLAHSNHFPPFCGICGSSPASEHLIWVELFFFNFPLEATGTPRRHEREMVRRR